MIGGRTDPVGHAEKELHRLFPDDADLSGATAWARETLAVQGRDASVAPLRSLRALRRADRRLSPVAARYLVEAVAGRRGSGGRLRDSPHLE